MTKASDAAFKKARTLIAEAKASDDAFKKARKLIAKAKASGATVLVLSRAGRALATVPKEIAELTALTTLGLLVTQVSDLRPIAGMTGITTLDLTGTQVSDLRPIAGMTGITTLDLSGTEVSDLRPIAGMTGITTLDLTGTEVSDLTPLAGLTGITTLGLTSTQVSDLTPLAGLTGITRLDLTGTQVSDLTPLAGITGITTLYLWGTRVSDLTPIAGMTGITTLDLTGTQVSDLTPLAGITGITWLDLSGTQVSDLTPIGGMRGLAENPGLLGLRFGNTPAARGDARLAEIAEIEDNAERARAMFAYLALPAVPEQEAAGLRYAIGPAGRLGYDPQVHNPWLPPEAVQIHSIIVADLSDLTVAFAGGGNRPYAQVSKHLDRYGRGLGADLATLQPALVWKAGNDLRLILRQDALRRPGDLNNTPPLGPDLRADLEGFVAAHNVLAALHPDLAALDGARIDPTDRPRAEIDRGLLQAAIDAFAAQTRLILGEVTDDLRDLHELALGKGQAADRALAIEESSIENLIKKSVAQAIVEVQGDRTVVDTVIGDARAALIGEAAVAVAHTFPQLIGVIQPELAAYLTALHGHEYSVLQAIEWIKTRIANRR